VTAVVFSATEIVAVPPPPFEEMTGASLAPVMVTAKIFDVTPPSPSSIATA
jgi:hypothetical protein